MSLFGSGRKEGVIAVCILLCLALLQHAPGLFFDQHRQSLSTGPDHQSVAREDLEGSSNAQIFLPAMRVAGQVVGRGSLPLWNRSARFGEPFDFSGAALLYPPFWLLMLSSKPWLIDLIFFLHSAMACAFMYRFLRAITMSRYVAFLGGGCYGLGWFMTVAADRLPEAAAATILPFALERTWRCLFSRRRLSIAPLWGLSIALMFLTTGSSTAWLGLWLCIGSFAVGLRAIDSFDRPDALRALAVASVVAVTLSSPLWIQDLQDSGARQVLERNPVRHLQAAGLIGLVTPTAFSDLQGHTPELMAEVNPGADPMELALYPGALMLYLLVLGLFRPKRTYQSLMWLLVFGAGLLLTLDGPIAEFIDAHTSWSSDRPGASLVLMHLAIVVLGSIALENYLNAPTSRRFSAPLTTTLCILTPGTLLLMAFSRSSILAAALQPLFGETTQAELGEGMRLLAVAIAPHAIALAIIGLLFITWRRFGLMKLKPAVAIIALGELCLLSFLEVSRSPQPIDGSSIVAHLSENSGRVITTAHCALPPASWLEVQGQQVIDSGANAILDRSSRYLALIDPSSSHDRPRNQRGPLSRPELLNHPLMNVAAVQAALSAPRPSIERSGGALAAPLLETYALDTYTAAHPLPRARVLFQTVVVKTQTQAAEVVSFRGDELDHLVVVENPPDDFFCQLPSSKPKIEWIEDSANRITLDVDVAEGSGYLLLADAYAPGWSATIDGTQSEILPADLAFRALPIASGKHRVEFEYLPWSLTIGLPLMFAGALLGMISTIVTLLRSRR